MKSGKEFKDDKEKDKDKQQKKKEKAEEKQRKKEEKEKKKLDKKDEKKQKHRTVLSIFFPSKHPHDKSNPEGYFDQLSPKPQDSKSPSIQMNSNDGVLPSSQNYNEDQQKPNDSGNPSLLIKHDRDSISNLETPTDILKSVLAISAPLEHVFNISDFPTEMNSFRMLNQKTVQVVGKDLYVSNLTDILKLLTFVQNKEFIKQILVYQQLYDGLNVLEAIIENFLYAFQSENSLREKMSASYVKILTTWLSTRSDQFSDQSLRLATMEFVKFLKGLVSNSQFLLSPVDEAEKAIATVFEANGIISIKKRRLVGQEDQEIAFEDVCIGDPKCLSMLPEQLINVELMFLSKINPHDYYVFLDNKTRNVSVVNTYVQWGRLFSLWIAYQIVREKDEERRRQCLFAVLSLATELLRKKNFNSFVRAMEGIEHQAVRRLEKTWNKLGKKEWIIYASLRDVEHTVKCTNASVTVQPPCVPDFQYQLERMDGMYKGVGEKESNKRDTMINLGRYTRIGAVIDVLGTYAAGNGYKENKSLIEFFTGEIYTLPLDDANLLDFSLRAEPPK
ncbi:hypothetical protein EIN_084980 [Entamoeba invadens IP1]|uniref:hypothetical protein n=1 Tax=Entamoeba invadens IP1 TaxID=370355 RepID=UPI0002C3D8D6|nr:hypothetical protein EIN_084980 [Entamoeba invadens IP1]ELP85286.1 hypothetical protein EIN_084980 [Entamoeba invadens IP1]|eukprot:XP_004184632.1 hypothetical protein EIN_084980 [Entamoeba invadens IP1]